MALPQSATDIQFLVTNTVRAYITNQQDIARHKTFLDATNLMAAPYSFTQAESDIMKGAINNLATGHGLTTLDKVNAQAGMF